MPDISKENLVEIENALKNAEAVIRWALDNGADSFESNLKVQGSKTLSAVLKSKRICKSANAAPEKATLPKNVGKPSAVKPPPANPKDLMAVEGTGVSMRINAPSIFARADFQEWLNAANRMSWHKQGEEPGDYSDVVVLVDSNFEGSDSDMPEDIWRAICDIVYAKFGDRNSEHVTVRLTNLEMDLEPAPTPRTARP